MENKELKVKHLIALRNNYFSMVIVISTGIAGLFFTNFGIIKMFPLMIAGVYFDYVFISKFLYINNKIKILTGDE